MLEYLDIAIEHRKIVFAALESSVSGITACWEGPVSVFWWRHHCVLGGSCVCLSYGGVLGIGITVCWEGPVSVCLMVES